MFWKEASKRNVAVTLEEKMEKDNSGALKPKGIESLDESIEASKTQNTDQKSTTVSTEEKTRDKNGMLEVMKLGAELQKEEKSKEEPKKEEENPKPQRTFPNTENVYHFHPIAFVNHMKRIFGEGSEDCPELV
ncbi:hypothetical protein [Tenacibaculum sp. SDUM215027]|uniref:hypothetical protein n=1 Tax=Tenacibaculum sp. SDUM215027 TaxID=3422596 RepID=UPI003D312E1D